ncbi:MAG: DNA translocase FtsK [Firmicutes bacterium]|nr:DNA translocase FtsK [Bacillota bacterium]
MTVKEEIKQQVKAIIIMALSALAFAALLFPRQTGEVGEFIHNVLRTLLGDISVFVPALLIINGLLTILPWKIPNLELRKLGVLLLLVILLVFAHLQAMERQMNLVSDLGVYKASLRLGLQQQGGGLFGAVFALILYFLFRDVGSYIVLLALTLISFIFITNISLSRLFSTAWRLISLSFRALWLGLKKSGNFITSFFAAGSDGDAGEAEEENTALEHSLSQEEEKFLPKEDNSLPATLFSVEDKPAAVEANIVAFPAKEEFKQPLQEKLVFTEPQAPKNFSPAENSKDDNYQLPPLDILPKVKQRRSAQTQKSLAEQAKILERTLDSFGVKAHITDVQAGPTVTRFELQPEIGVKVSKIVSLADDLALNLAASDVRIEAPIPGKAAVGIEVPNKVIAPVYLREVLENEQFQKSPSVLTVALGKDITGAPVVADLMKMPHLLIAGSTGSGKSVCLNALIASILFKAHPQEVKFVMIDPKVVELSVYNGIPHLLMPVVSDPKRASLALKNMVKEMTRRYELFAAESVRDIHGYNERKRQENKEMEQLPFIVVIIDELADLMMVAAADVEDSIARLAQMSRAAGIHLVIATQRPSVDVITGVIKANITSRIAFAVSSQADSRTILDMGGAEKLLGRGDALFHPIGQPKPFRIQGAFIHERELNHLLEFIKKQGEPEYSEQLLPEENEVEDFYEEDELFPDAVMLFAETGTASISLLQRRFRIGYTRAARLVDDMERRGFIGKFEGSKPREVLITVEQAKKLLFERESV